MDAQSQWPSKEELDDLRETVAAMAGRTSAEVRVVVSPYRICPLGAHIDHQGGVVSAMAINLGVLLAFVPSGNSQVILRSKQFKGEVRFGVHETQYPMKSPRENGVAATNGQNGTGEECSWGRYARAALYALQSRGNNISQGITGVICGYNGLDSSGLSSSAAVGVAYLLAFESANELSVSPTENIEYDRLIENEYLGLNNGILDQSAILLSSYGCLTFMDCKTKEYKLIHPPEIQKNDRVKKKYKILLASSGLKHALTANKGYNCRVAECREAAKILLGASAKFDAEPILSNVELEVYEAHKGELNPLLARRAEHYFSENMRVRKGLEAWSSGDLEEFGKLITASGQSSIHNYECGCEPLIQLYEILVKTRGVFGARFSGAGFRGCCIALVDADYAAEAAAYIRTEYAKVQPQLADKIDPENAVLICNSSDAARIL